MTVIDTSFRELYSGNGTTTTFAIPTSEYTSDDHVYVVLRSTAGSETVQVLNSGYSISGGNVMTTFTPASGEKLLVKINVGYTQGVDYSANGSLGSFKGSTHETALDNIVRQTQQLDEAVDRSVRLQETILESSFNPILPRDIVSAGGGYILATYSSAGSSGFTEMSNSITIGTVTGASAAASAAASSASDAAASAATAAGSAVTAAGSALTAAGSATLAASHATQAGAYSTIALTATTAVFDNTFTIVDDTDVTKRIKFDVGTATASSDLVFKAIHSTNRTVTVPDADDTFVMRATADTFTNKTFDLSAAGNVLSNISNANINAGAGIVYTKLSLTTQVATGDLSADVFSGLTSVTASVLDYAAIADASDSNSKKKALVSDFKRLNVRSVTTTDSPVTTDDVLLCSDASFTINLFTASTCIGKILEFVHDGVSLTQTYTIDPNDSETVDGSSTTTINTTGERLRIFSDGANWKKLSRDIPVVLTSYTPVVGATTTAPGYGPGYTQSAHWARYGQVMEIQYNLFHNTAGTAGAGAYLFPLPSSAYIDTTKALVPEILANSTLAGHRGQLVGTAYFGETSLGDANFNTQAVVIVANSSSCYILGIAGSALTRSFPFSSNNATNFSDTQLYVTFTARVPIAGWNG